MKTNFVKKTLPNGLRVIFEKTKKNNIVINVGVKVGMLDETPETNGVSHFLEHMLWDGTATKTAKEIRDAVKDMNGEFNACTGYEITNYYVEVPRKHFEKALQLIIGVITNPKLNEEEINKEKNIILNEKTMYFDAPFYRIDNLTKSTLFEGTMLGNDIIGTNENIQKMTKQMLEEHYNKYYSPNNTVITVIGNIEGPTEKIQNLYTTQPKKIPETKKVEPKVILPKKIIQTADTLATYVQLGYLTVNFEKKESKALKIIEYLLDEGKNTSIMEEVRYNHGLTYDVHTYSHSLRTTGLFAVGLSTEKSEINRSLELIKKQIQKIQEIKKPEIEKAKREIIKSIKECLKEPSLKVLVYTDNELTNGWDEYLNVEKKLKAITLEDVKQTAKTYLTENNSIEAIIEQKEEK